MLALPRPAAISVTAMTSTERKSSNRPMPLGPRAREYKMPTIMPSAAEAIWPAETRMPLRRKLIGPRVVRQRYP